MKMSDQKPAIHEALSAVMDDVKSVGKNERNESQRFSFRGIDAVLNAVGPALRAHGVIVLPTLLDHSYETVTSAKGSAMGHVFVKVMYTFVGPAGDSLACSVVGESMDVGDKATAKAMSVAFRTALLQALTLPTDEPDPDSQTYEIAAQPVKKKEQPATSHADSGRVLELVAWFNDVQSTDDLAGLAEKIPTLDISQGDKEVLRRSYLQAKKRIEG